MKHWVLSLLLVLASPALLAAPERVADVLEDLQAHGYVSPSAAAARLQAAADAGDADAPIEQQRRYYVELIALAVQDRNTLLLQQSLDRLGQLAEQAQCKPCQASWLIGKAQAAITSRDLRSARELLQQAAASAGSGKPEVQLELALAQVRMERQQGAMNVAFGHAMAGLDLAEKLNDDADRIRLQIDLAVIDSDLGFVDRAEATARDAVARAKSSGFTAALALAYITQSYIASAAKDSVVRLRTLQQALAIAEKVPGLDLLEAKARINLSDWYLNAHEYAAALEQGQAGAELARARRDPYAESIATTNVGVALAESGQVDEGLAKLHEALALARRSGNLRAESVVNRELVKELKAAGHYQQALEALQAIDEVNARITRQERDSAVLELQAKYDDERKNREIERLSTQARLKDAEASARRWQQGLWTVLATVAVLVAIFMVIRLARARRANRQLKRDVASLTEQSSLDELTGTFNRRHFAALMQPYEDDPEARVGLVMLDIDRFKRINDNFGHGVGDLVLKEVASRLQALGRERDSVVRWGGEEFVLVLPGASEQGLSLMAKRLLEAVAGEPIRIGHQSLHVSVSAGCVVHPLEPGSPWEHALRLADQTMYRAKQHGRNRAACATMHNRPPEQGDGDPTAFMHASTVEITEVAGPTLPAQTTAHA